MILVLFSKYRKMSESRFIKIFLLKVSNSLRASSASFLRAQSTSSWSLSWIPFRVYWRSGTAVAEDLILRKLNDGQHSLFYNPHPFIINFSEGLRGYLMISLSQGARNAHPQIRQGFCWWATQCALRINSNQNSLDRLSYLPALVQEMVPSGCFPRIYNYWSITHYHNHWSYKIEYLVNISNHLIIILFKQSFSHKFGNAGNNSLVK